MILEITQLIWLTTPKGQAIAKFLIDYGPEADLQVGLFHPRDEGSMDVFKF